MKSAFLTSIFLAAFFVSFWGTSSTRGVSVLSPSGAHELAVMCFSEFEYVELRVSSVATQALLAKKTIRFAKDDVAGILESIEDKTIVAKWNSAETELALRFPTIGNEEFVLEFP